MKVHPYGDGALYIDLEADEAHGSLAERTRSLATYLRAQFPQSEIVTGAESLAVIGAGAPLEEVARIAESLMTGAPPAGGDPHVAPVREHEVAVVYDGPDLDEVARAAHLSVAQLIALHSSHPYQVELMGFLPGFAYLGPVDPRLALPRRPSPRPRVPAGSLGLAGGYTGVYPLACPGGWHLLGRVLEITLFDPHRDPVALFQVGDRVRFLPA